MEQETRKFHLGDVLSITTGALVAPRKMDAVYDILGYMVGEQLWTHQLPRVADECKPFLLEQHPQLTDIDASSVDGDNWGKRRLGYGVSNSEYRTHI